VPCAPPSLALVFFLHTTTSTSINFDAPRAATLIATVDYINHHDCHTTVAIDLATNISIHIMSACQQPHMHTRPQPQPHQNVLDVNSDDSLSSIPSSSSGRGSMHNIFSSPEIARCSRCHRTPSIDIKTGKSNMVQYGLNQYYCSRCATMVGFFNR